MEALTYYTEDQLARVDNFKIGRRGFGWLCLEGMTDLRYLNFDELIEIGRMACTVYVCLVLIDCCCFRFPYRLIIAAKEVGEARPKKTSKCVCLIYYFSLC